MKPCAEPRCPELVQSGRCAKHAHWRNDDRPTAYRRGYDGRHQRWRKMVLNRQPQCVACGAPATVADHVVPLSQGGGWEIENGQGMCVPCHNSKTARER